MYFEARAEQFQLRIDMRELVDRILDAADVLQLAARMAVHELQAVEHVLLAQHLDASRISVMKRPNFDFSPAESRQRPEPLARELDAHADARPHAVLFACLRISAELGEVLDHRDDGAAELGGEDHGLDVAVVLEAVADDQAVGANPRSSP
jgi:hypothetical protein